MIQLVYNHVPNIDYTSASNVKIKSDALYVLTLEPGVKLIANLKNGWQPYLGVSFVQNFDMGGEVKANNVVLPEVSIKPYLKYGLDIRRTWKDNLSGFAQAFVTNGGRNGIGLQVGFNWLFDTRDIFIKKKNKQDKL